MKRRALQELKRHSGCILLARILYRNTQLANPHEVDLEQQGQGVQKFEIIDFFDSLYEVGMLDHNITKEVSIGTRQASLDETIDLNSLSPARSPHVRTAFVDIRNHKGEVLYVNKNIVHHWRHPGGDISNMVLGAYGIPLSMERPTPK